MPLIVKYYPEHDILDIWTGEKIETSSSCEKYMGLVIDFKDEECCDPVGFELMGAAKLLAPVLEEMIKRAAYPGPHATPAQAEGPAQD